MAIKSTVKVRESRCAMRQLLALHVDCMDDLGPVNAKRENARQQAKLITCTCSAIDLGMQFA